MPGYPYFYGPLDTEREDHFIKFSINPVLKNKETIDHSHDQSQYIPITLLEELINQTESLPLSVLAEPLITDRFSYTFCNEFTELCGNISIIPNTNSLVIEYDGFCKLMDRASIIVDNISSRLSLPKEEVMNKTAEFFTTRNIIVQPIGIHGAIYTAGSYVQATGSVGLITRTLSLAKLAGVSGLQILQAQPILIVAIPTTGAIFFHSCGAIAGENVVGKALITIGNTLALPMRGAEILWNSYGNPVIQRVFGIPLIFNLTKTLNTGEGYSVKEIESYVGLDKPSVMKIIKTKTSQLVQWLVLRP